MTLYPPATKYDCLWQTDVAFVCIDSIQIPKAIQKYGPSGEPNQAVSNPQLSVDEPGECNADGLKGWNIEHCLPGSVFEELDKSPERADSFSGAMRFISKNPGFDMRHLFDSFDWESLSGKTLTDVGGSTGHASMYIAERVPDLSCVVQDRPEVIDQLRQSASSSLARRISYEAHDMFQDQTRQSDAFLLRLVLHDWSEEYARKILKALIPGMRSGTKVLVQDMILPGHGDDISHLDQKIMRFVVKQLSRKRLEFRSPLTRAEVLISTCLACKMDKSAISTIGRSSLRVLIGGSSCHVSIAVRSLFLVSWNTRGREINKAKDNTAWVSWK